VSDPSTVVPEVRPDLLRRVVDDGVVVWSPVAPEPVALDPVSGVMLDVIDGDASVTVLAREVHEEVGIDLALAQAQVERAVDVLGAAGALMSSRGVDAAAQLSIDQRELFVNPCLACMAESAATMATLVVRIGGHAVGVACDSLRAIKRLKRSLGDLADESAVDPERLGFVLTAPAGLHRNHCLNERSGFVLSDSRGIDSGLAALASHLTSLLPVAPGHVRFRATAIAGPDRLAICLYPISLIPPLVGRTLADAGYRRVDRLTIDVEVATGRLVPVAVPWPELVELDAAPGHSGPEIGGSVDVVVTAAHPGMARTSRAAAVAQLASGALGGTPSEAFDAAVRLVEGATVVDVAPEPDSITADVVAALDAARRR